MKGRWSYGWAMGIGAVLALALIMFLATFDAEYMGQVSILRVVTTGLAGAFWGFVIAWVRNRFVPKVKVQARLPD